MPRIVRRMRRRYTREEAKTKNIELSVKASNGADMEVTGNKQEIIRVLQNLLENAVKFTPHQKAISMSPLVNQKQTAPAR
jgi:signal transduction histidine kinase